MQISPKIHLLKHDFEIAFGPTQKVPRFVYSIIIFGKDISLIDCGVKNSWQSIFDYIEKENRNPEEINKLILSHSHPDHMGSAAKIKELCNCEIMAHLEEQNWFENIDLQYKQRSVPGFYELVDTSIKIDRFVEHNQLLKIDKDITLRIFHSPGHSKGSINILFEEAKILFTADSIPLKNDIPNYDNYHELKASLQRIRNNKDVEILLSSWAQPVSNKSGILQLMDEGEKYLKKIDTSVNINYTGEVEKIFEHCGKVVNDLGLPPFCINLIVDKAFRTHLE